MLCDYDTPANTSSSIEKKRTELKLIVAHGKNKEIGKNGALPWPALKEDMKSFKKLTTTTLDPSKKNACIMGRKTYESIPPKYRPLSGRINIVLTRCPQNDNSSSENLYFVSSFEEALRLTENENVESVYVIGGAQVYQLALESGLVRDIYVTHIAQTFEADTYFPVEILQEITVDYKVMDYTPFEEHGLTYDITHLHYTVLPVDQKNTVMVSGHTNLTETEWNQYYKPEIDKFIEKGYFFVVGGAQGCDTFTQNYLATFAHIKVTVYDKLDQNHVVCDRFEHINGFPTYTHRDEAMTKASNVDIAFLHQYGGGGSGTCANLLRRKFGSYFSEAIIKLIRQHSLPYEKK